MSGLTPDQIRASDPGRTAFVAASAGTGKTHVLIARMVRLMLTGTDPDELLCLTFTKAAAAEMKARLYSELGTWTQLSDNALSALLHDRFALTANDAMIRRARRLFTTTLDLSQDLRIQTFHSFCQSILGRFPIESGLIPGFKAAEEDQSKSVMLEARDEALIQSRTNEAFEEAIQQLAEQTTEGTFQTLMDDLRGEQATLETGIKGYGGASQYLASLDAALGLVGSSKDTLIKEAVDNLPLTPTTLSALQACLATGGTRDKGNAAALEGIGSLEWSVDQIAAYKKLSNWLLTKDGKVKSPDYVMTKSLRKSNPQFEPQLDAIMVWIEALQQNLIKRQLADQSRALLMIGAQQIGLYDAIKRREGLVDFSDMVDRTVRLISSAEATEWIRFKLDQEITHILVDEAQDTNEDQWQVVNALALEFFAGLGAFDVEATNEGDRVRTVFAVGDEKQSIFSFQGADPSQFVAQRAALTEKAVEAGQVADTIRMDTSFRSGRAVLNLVDNIFQGRDLASKGVLFDRAELHHGSARDKAGGDVTLWPLEEEDTLEPDEPWSAPIEQRLSRSAESRLAARIAEDIQYQITNKVMLESRGRPVEPGDFLILVRRRKGYMDVLSRALEQLDLPVAGRDRMKLPEELAVMDLMALARAALLPEDDLTLATVLKGPFIGLSEDQLFTLAHDRQKQSLYGRLTAATDGALQKAKDRFKMLIRDAERLDVAPYFRSILEKHGGRYALLKRVGEDCADPLNAFIEAAENYDRTERGSLLGFLQQMDRTTTDLKRDLEGARGAIRIMTAHSSKGLQAPIVYLADTTSMPDTNQDKRLLSWQPSRHKPAFLLWTSGIKHLDLINDLKNQKEQLAAEEYNRLLYVALTRAEDRLIITGVNPKREPDDRCWYRAVERGFDRLGVPAATSTEPRQFKVAQSMPVAKSKERMTIEDKVIAPLWLREKVAIDPDPKRPLRPSHMPPAPRQTSLSSLFEVSSKAKSVRENPLKLGTIIHQALEWLPGVDPSDRERETLRFFEKRIGAKDAQNLADQVIAVFNHPDLKELMSLKGQSEVGLSGIAGADTIVGRIDRLLLSKREIVFADFKTGHFIPENADKVPLQTLYQMGLYARILKRIYPDKHLKPLLIYTSNLTLIQLDPKALEASLIKSGH